MSEKRSKQERYEIRRQYKRAVIDWKRSEPPRWRLLAYWRWKKNKPTREKCIK